MISLMHKLVTYIDVCHRKDGAAILSHFAAIAEGAKWEYKCW